MQEIICRRLTEADLQHFVGLMKVYEDAFEMEDFTIPTTHYLQGLLRNENIIFFVALSHNQVVSGLTAHILPSTHFESSEIYIYDFAVTPSMQRQGIGRQLMQEFKAHCTALNFKEIFVQADMEDQHARDFYAALGGTSAPVVHFSFRLGNFDTIKRIDV